jgi:hypothetical protein
MQDDSKEDTKADESDDDLADLQAAIHASLRASFGVGQVTQYLSGTAGENVASDEATTRVENLHEHASLDIVREGVLNASVDSDQGMASHGPFHLENEEPHHLHDHYSAFWGGPVSTFWSRILPSTLDSYSQTAPFLGRKDHDDGTKVQCADGDGGDAKLPAVSDVAAAEDFQDNHLESPPPVRLASPCHQIRASAHLCLLDW